MSQRGESHNSSEHRRGSQETALTPRVCGHQEGILEKVVLEQNPSAGAYQAEDGVREER